VIPTTARRLSMKSPLTVSMCAALLIIASGSRSETKDDDLVLCKEITKTKASLSDGIRQSSRTETPISAKFELDEKGKLSLSVYTAGKGTNVDAEGNVLKEWAGTPDGGQWAPVAETFNDVEHVARASQQLTLMALTGKTLVEIAAKADKEQLGSTYAITPVLRGKKAYFEVRFLNKGKVTEVKYDLLSASKM
jgi:hypothetical protein